MSQARQQVRRRQRRAEDAAGGRVLVDARDGGHRHSRAPQYVVLLPKFRGLRILRVLRGLRILRGLRVLRGLRILRGLRGLRSLRSLRRRNRKVTVFRALTRSTRSYAILRDSYARYAILTRSLPVTRLLRDAPYAILTRLERSIHTLEVTVFIVVIAMMIPSLQV